MIDVYSYFKKMQDEDVILYFKGEITNNLLTSILQLVDDRLEHKNEDIKIKKKVFSVLLECLQNIYNYQQQLSLDHPWMHSAALMIRRTEASYHIITGNYVEPEKVPTLKEKIDRVNGLDQDALKRFYKEVLSQHPATESGGAGLGIIDMARKSGGKIIYDFEETLDGPSFYSIEIKVEI
ncbi:MAG: hypothetical protein HC913_20100 [Microscillaceae bacterium]|nr:hypothetical protein [Microscillaceae bacterium]